MDTANVNRLLFAKGLRAFGDGFVSLLLPLYLLELGYSALEVGIIASATLLGSGALTLVIGLHAYRYHYRTLLLAAAVLMAFTGLVPSENSTGLSEHRGNITRAGNRHMALDLAVTSDGRVHSWGANERLQLGRSPEAVSDPTTGTPGACSRSGARLSGPSPYSARYSIFHEVRLFRPCRSRRGGRT